MSTPFFIQSLMDSNLVIAIQDGKNTPGTPLDAHNKLNGHDSQLWTFEPINPRGAVLLYPEPKEDKNG